MRWWRSAADSTRGAGRPRHPATTRSGPMTAHADVISDEDLDRYRAIGEHGRRLIRALHARHPDRPVNLLTRCDAGGLATIDYDTATAPIYLAHDEGIPDPCPGRRHAVAQPGRALGDCLYHRARGSRPRLGGFSRVRRGRLPSARSLHRVSRPPWRSTAGRRSSPGSPRRRPTPGCWRPPPRSARR
jgi:hypothetical protein